MTTNYPSSLDTTAGLGNTYTDSTPTETEHYEQHNNLADALLAIETELGVLPKGGFATVAARLGGLVALSPAAQQIVQPSGDYLPVAVKANASQTADLFQLKNSGGTLIGSIDKDGVADAAGYRVSGTALASTHLTDSSSILRNPSPSITTPSISDAAMTGTPTAPTQSAADNSTKVATTAYVVSQGHAKLASPALTGVPTAPTAVVGTNTTQIATTEFTIDQIVATPAPPVDTGIMVAYAGSSAPAGWLLCDGTAVSRTTYSALFAILSTSYGVGDGSTTFNLPDFRGRLVVGLGSHVDVDSLGDNDGVAVGTRRPKHAHSFSLSGSSGGNHNHGVSVSGVGDHTHGFTGTSGSTGVTEGPGSAKAQAGGVGTSSAGGHSHSLGSIGVDGGAAHSVTGTLGASGTSEGPAYLALNYIIKT